MKISTCCNASTHVYSGDEGTNHYVCEMCSEPCDYKPDYPSDTKDEGSFEMDISCKNPTHEDLLYRLSKNRIPAWIKIITLTIISVGIVHFVALNQVSVCEDALRRIINL